MKDRQTSMDILFEKINPAEKRQTVKRRAFFLFIRNEWDNHVKEIPRK
jgi:hypothetical protein